jgi:hypothetical protein
MTKEVFMKTIALVFLFALMIYDTSPFGQDQKSDASPKGPNQLTCGGQGTITDAIGLLSRGDVLFVSGTCNET